MNHLGRKRSKETCKKISESKFKKVLHIESGEVFKSQTEAAKHFDIGRTTISAHCNGQFKNQRFKTIE